MWVGRSLRIASAYGIVADKTRILVTHHLHVLPQVDLILVMDNGQVVRRGHMKNCWQVELNSRDSSASTLVLKMLKRRKRRKSKRGRV